MRGKASIYIATIVAMLLPFFFTKKSIAQVDEYRLKAEWIYTLIPYMKWVGKSHKSINVCTIGQESVNNRLKDVITEEERSARKSGDKYTPLHLLRKSAASDFDDCQVLYISLSEQGNLPNLLKRIENKHILTISSIPNFASKGGVVELAISHDNLIIRVSESAAAKAKIHIDSDLLGFVEKTD